MNKCPELVWLNTQLPDTLKEAVRVAAALRGVSMSKFVRQIITAALFPEKGEKKWQEEVDTPIGGHVVRDVNDPR